MVRSPFFICVWNGPNGRHKFSFSWCIADYPVPDLKRFLRLSSNRDFIEPALVGVVSLC